MADTPEKDQKEIEEKVSKNAAKKTEKAVKKAEIIAEKKTASGDAATEMETEDFAKDMYGQAASIVPQQKVDRDLTEVKELSSSLADQLVWIRGAFKRGNGNGFLQFFTVQEQQYTVQALVAVGDKVSKQMVKFAAGINKESIVEVQGIVKKVDQKIDSCSQQDIELHVGQLFVVSSAEARLPLLIENASKSERNADQGLTGIRRVSFTTLSGPAPPAPPLHRFGGQLNPPGKEGHSFVEFRDEKEYIESLKNIKCSWDLKMKSFGPNGKPTRHGFISQRTDQDFIPPSDKVKQPPPLMSTVCDGELLLAAESLIASRAGKEQLSVTKFFLDDDVVPLLSKVASFLSQAPWNDSRQLNRFVRCLAVNTDVTFQTLNWKLSELM